MPESIDRSKLEAAVKAGREKDKSLYTESSWKVYDEAISEAEVILADADATQAEVDSALTKLELAEKKLIKIANKNNSAAKVDVEKESKKESALPKTGTKYPDIAIKIIGIMSLTTAILISWIKRKKSN